MFKFILHIDGMHCPMCEAHVGDIIRRHLKVGKIRASHHKGEAVVFSGSEYDEADFRNALSDSGYLLVGFEKTEAKIFLCFWR